MHELILGGQRSGKSARAEVLAAQWLAASAMHKAVFVATAQPWDDEMRARITRHQQDRTQRVPGMVTVEEPLDLPGVLMQHNAADTLVVVDCLTLWLTNLRMPAKGVASERDDCGNLCAAIRAHSGQLVIVSNEIGLGVIPMGADVRAFVDALGRLNQQVAAVCGRVTLMAAGLPLTLKGGA